MQFRIFDNKDKVGIYTSHFEEGTGAALEYFLTVIREMAYDAQIQEETVEDAFHICGKYISLFRIRRTPYYILMYGETDVNLLVPASDIFPPTMDYITVRSLVLQEDVDTSLIWVMDLGTMLELNAYEMGWNQEGVSTVNLQKALEEKGYINIFKK